MTPAFMKRIPTSFIDGQPEHPSDQRFAPSCPVNPCGEHGNIVSRKEHIGLVWITWPGPGLRPFDCKRTASRDFQFSRLLFSSRRFRSRLFLERVRCACRRRPGARGCCAGSRALHLRARLTAGRARHCLRSGQPHQGDRDDSCHGMLLHERRLLALDVPVTDWLPEFAAAEHSDSRRRE